ncbi:MAG TPA: RusA family crossover junction endodeoxyribonuclease [Solirubrobacteraceae bacterium]
MPCHVLGHPELDDDVLSFDVLGRPATAGSKKAIAIKRKGEFTGKVAVIDDARRGKPWREAVQAAAIHAVADQMPRGAQDGSWFGGGALLLTVVFFLRRPKSHFGTGRNARQLKPSAPRYPTTTPDCTKMIRAVEDALTGVIWRDDAQVVQTLAVKSYTDFDEPEHALVSIKEAA